MLSGLMQCNNSWYEYFNLHIFAFWLLFKCLIQIETQSEVDLLRHIVKDMKKECQCVKDLESKVGPVIVHTEETPNDSSIEDYLRCQKFLYLIGGNNGERWLDSLDSYSPKLDILTPLKKMCCPRSYAAATIFDDGFCVFGGRYGDSNLWHKSGIQE